MPTDRKKRGSLTLEAAMALPLALFIILAMVGQGHRLHVHEKVQHALDASVPQAALVSYTVMSSEVFGTGMEKLAELGLPEEFRSFFSGVIVNDLVAESLVRQHLDEGMLEAWGVVDGWSGMDFSGTVLKGEDNRTTLSVSYRLAFPLPLGPAVARAMERPILQTASTRIWTGHLGLFAQKVRKEDGEEADEDKVYIAASGNGIAYHLLACLQLPMEQLVYSEPFGRDICLTCLKATGLPEAGDPVWVKEGAAADSKYHTVEHCRTIYKEAQAVTLEEAVLKNLKPCSKCHPPVLQTAE